MVLLRIYGHFDGCGPAAWGDSANLLLSAANEAASLRATVEGVGGGGGEPPCLSLLGRCFPEMSPSDS